MPEEDLLEVLEIFRVPIPRGNVDIIIKTTDGDPNMTDVRMIIEGRTKRIVRGFYTLTLNIVAHFSDGELKGTEQMEEENEK